MMMRTSCPRWTSALLRPATTSPRPPVCASGVHSEATNRMRRGRSVLPQHGRLRGRLRARRRLRGVTLAGDRFRGDGRGRREIDLRGTAATRLARVRQACSETARRPIGAVGKRARAWRFRRRGGSSLRGNCGNERLGGRTARAALSNAGAGAAAGFGRAAGLTTFATGVGAFTGTAGAVFAGPARTCRPRPA